MRDFYIIKYKPSKSFFWRKVKDCYGHTYHAENDKMEIHHLEGILVIANWNNYDFYLDSDYVEMQKRMAEEESGQSLPFKRNTK